jgi:hypothetical protein
MKLGIFTTCLRTLHGKNPRLSKTNLITNVGVKLHNEFVDVYRPPVNPVWKMFFRNRHKSQYIYKSIKHARWPQKKHICKITVCPDAALCSLAELTVSVINTFTSGQRVSSHVQHSRQVFISMGART